MTSLTANAARSTMRRAALIGGLGLLLMSLLAGLANFAVLERVVSEGDAARTASEILEAFDSFRLAIVALFLVASLDRGRFFHLRRRGRADGLAVGVRCAQPVPAK